MRLPAALGLLGLTAGLAAGALGSATSASAPRADPVAVERPVVLVSGRDDHGLLTTSRVGLAARPEGPVLASVADATLVAVLGTKGQWLRVRSLTGPVVEGWVNDFHLRGVVHLRASAGACEVVLTDVPNGPGASAVPANTQVTLLEVAQVASGTWVKVRPADAPDTWVERTALHELPGDRVVAEAAGCRKVATAPVHHQHHH